MLRTPAALALLLSLLACGEVEPDPEPYVQPAPWEQLNFEEREEFMTWVFSPTMEDLFLAEDPALYDGFECETCHGDDPHYEMPAVDVIDPLTLDDVPVDSIDDPERLEVALWMEETILPAMADMFEQEMNLEGASCLDCHPFE
ncbi:MAG: hypothetical protein GY898_15690 [Proteobacteria bacterium]|nr:hypothetical protein [Pseudomonadota bacterium]